MEPPLPLLIKEGSYKLVFLLLLAKEKFFCYSLLAPVRGKCRDSDKGVI